MKNIFACLIVFLVASFFISNATYACTFELISPENPESVSREVMVKIKVSPGGLVEDIKSGNKHLYIFQRNELESEQIWHFVAKKKYSMKNIFSAKMWLGGVKEGIDEDYLVRIIISTDKKSYETGSHNADRAYENGMPKIECEEFFPFHRSK